MRAIMKVVPWVGLVVVLFLVARQVYPRVDLGARYGPAPSFELMDLEGKPFRLADHVGEVLVINFWATWCPPCRAEIPGFVSLQEELRDEGVLFVGISLDDDGAASVAPYVERRDINYPILLNGHRVAAAFGGVTALPTTLIVDRQGEIRFWHEGFLLPSALRPAIRELARS